MQAVRKNRYSLRRVCDAPHTGHRARRMQTHSTRRAACGVGHRRGDIRYVIIPKDFEKGYKTNVKKSDTDFEFYR